MSTSFPSLAQTPRAFPLPTVAEDTLHYTLHSPSTSATETDALAVLITEYVESLLVQPWLWNKDGWELKPVEGKKGQLEGRMRVGDAVDDEWAVVWLLKQVSQKWKDLVISIRDTDGEFLLIEAANELPAWVSPENAENRLWLQDGHLHLIPLSVRSSTTGLPRPIPDEEEDEKRFDAETYLNEEDGVQAVRTGKYRADDKMEQAVWDRISSYPDALKTHQHRTKAWLPEPIARALSQKPELIQKAVEGFYVRDPVQLRAASRMTHFPPSPAVLSSVLMTRAAYAQLQGQVFHPPRVFGPEWHIREGQDLDDERRWRDLGVKIATGFEIMYREGGARGRSGQKDAAAEDIHSTAEYQTFISNLKRAGFFGTELEGSEKWKQREEEALKGWRQVRSADTSAQRPSFAYQVDQAIQASSTTDQSSLQVSPDDPEDSDKWLEVSPDELDGMMQRASGASGPVVPGERAEVGDEHGRALGDLAKMVEEFVGGQGDVEGARFVDELSDEDMDDDSDEEEPQGLTAAEKDERMRNLVAPLPDNEWGRKTQQTVVTAPKGESKKGNVNEHSGMKMRPPRFAKQQFDGVESDSDDDVDEADLPPVGTIGRQIAQMKWGDMGPKIEEIDDEEEEEKKAARSRRFDMGDDIDEQMRRRVWGGDDDVGKGDEAPMVVNDGDEMDVDMELEGEEFLEFAKQELGIDEDMWRDIVASRKARGVFVPEPSKKAKVNMSSLGASSAQHLPSGSSVSQQEPTSQPATADQTQTEVNMDLDSFDKVMAAMDAELAKIKGPQQASQPTLSNTQPKAAAKVKFASLPDLPSEADLDDLDDEDLAAMDRELKAALKNAGVEDVSDDEIPEADELDDEGKREYKMMKDFLESYRSQGGQSGVVGNLFGRLGEEKKK